jgi:hypothetical protein
MAEYLYKDEIINNPRFQKEVETLGLELYEKTGISLRLLMLKELPNGATIADYEKEVLKDFQEPTVLLTFSEMNSKVDIIANDKSLYKYFDKKQILSPAASSAQALAMAVVFARSWNDFKEMLGDSGGTILPLLGNKGKEEEILGKYSAALYNGYADIAGQIASFKEVDLEHGVGKSHEYIIFGIKILFYGLLLYAMFLYLRNKFYSRKKENEVQ